jgi:hypothetical protein
MGQEGPVSITPGPWRSLVRLGYEGPEMIVERDVGPASGGGISLGSRPYGMLCGERTLARPRDPWLEDDGWRGRGLLPGSRREGCEA